MRARRSSFAFTVAAGLLMVSGTLPGASILAMAVAGVAAVLVVASLRIRSAAAAAVIASVVALAIGNPLAASAVLAGLAATAFLLLSSAIDAPAGVLTMTKQTLIGAVAFAGVGLAATAVPLDLAWAPLAGPVLVVLIFGIAVAPYVARDSRKKVARRGEPPPE